MSLTRTTILVTSASMLNLLISFGSQLAIATLFGASTETDGYFLAMTLPMLLISMVGTVTSTALIPSFIETRAKWGEASSWRLASTSLIWMMLGLIVLCSVGFVIADGLISAIAPDLSYARRSATADVLRASLIWSICMAYSQHMTSLYHVDEKFVVPAVSASFSPMGMIVGGVLFHGELGIYSLVVGQTAGALAQAFYLSRKIFNPEKLWNRFVFGGAGLRMLLRMSIPLLLGGCVYQLIPVIERYFASGLAVGSITYLSIANRIGGVIAPLLVSGLAIAIFPRLSTHTAYENPEAARATLSLAIRSLLVAAIPITILSPYYAMPLTEVLFQHGRFDFNDVAIVADVLPYYIVALTAAAFGTLVGKGFYGLLHDTLTPTIITIFHVFLYILLCAWLVPSFGLLGLAVAHAVFWVLNISISSLLLGIKIGAVRAHGIAKTVIQSCFASALVYATLWPMPRLNLSPWQELLIIAAGFLLYAFLVWKVFKVQACLSVEEKLRTLIGKRSLLEGVT